ncbi:MAG TPA: exopolysaccharide biosynthesis protein [Alphaproteobacteria bacterium]
MANPHEERRRVSEIITKLACEPKLRVSLDDLLALLGDRAFGVLMLILSLPNAVGLGTIPGLSTVFGVPQVIVAMQMIMGRHRPWLPAWLRSRTIGMEDFRAMTAKSVPYLVKIERMLRPRFEFMAAPLAERLLGVVFAVLAILVALPIPFANQPPAVAMAVIALGLIAYDGVFIVAGLVIGVIALAIAAGVIVGAIAAVWLTIRNLVGL